MIGETEEEVLEREKVRELAQRKICGETIVRVNSRGMGVNK